MYSWYNITFCTVVPIRNFQRVWYMYAGSDWGDGENSARARPGRGPHRRAGLGRGEPGNLGLDREELRLEVR